MEYINLIFRKEDFGNYYKTMNRILKRDKMKFIKQYFQFFVGSILIMIFSFLVLDFDNDIIIISLTSFLMGIAFLTLSLVNYIKLLLLVQKNRKNWDKWLEDSSKIKSYKLKYDDSGIYLMADDILVEMNWDNFNLKITMDDFIHIQGENKRFLLLEKSFEKLEQFESYKAAVNSKIEFEYKLVD